MSLLNSDDQLVIPIARRQQWTAVAAITIVLIATGALGVALNQDRLFPVEAGKRAPNFHARDLSTGEEWSLAHYSGHVVIVNIWATWCGPCRQEMPSFQRLYEKFAGSGLRIAAVSVDRGTTDSVVAEFARLSGLTFDILRDSTRRIALDYEAHVFPFTVVINDLGVIAMRHAGSADWNSPEAQTSIRGLLAEATVRTRERETRRLEPQSPNSRVGVR